MHIQRCLREMQQHNEGTKPQWWEVRDSFSPFSSLPKPRGVLGREEKGWQDTGHTFPLISSLLKEELLKLCAAFEIFHLPAELAEAPDELPDGIPGPSLWRHGTGGTSQGAEPSCSDAPR